MHEHRVNSQFQPLGHNRLITQQSETDSIIQGTRVNPEYVTNIRTRTSQPTGTLETQSSSDHHQRNINLSNQRNSRNQIVPIRNQGDLQTISEFSNANFPDRFNANLNELPELQNMNREGLEHLEENLKLFRQKVGVVAHYKVQYFYLKIGFIMVNLLGIAIAIFLIASQRNSKFDSLIKSGGNLGTLQFKEYDFMVVRISIACISLVEIIIVIATRKFQQNYERNYNIILNKLKSTNNEIYIVSSKFWMQSYFLDSLGKALSGALF